jgi:hypothetical protein
LAKQFSTQIRPLLTKYCLSCHSASELKGELNLERFATLAAARTDVAPWQSLVEQVAAGEMPPKENPQPTASERKLLLDWTRAFLAAEALARAGDPGRVPLSRLSNAEYDYTVQDLTGVDLRPAREFPTDGAAGEGFTNAAEALAMSPAMMAKYLAAAKEIAAHAVLLPDGFRFSATKSRRDWTDESVARLRKFYAQHTSRPDGGLPLASYLSALVRHREELQSGSLALADLAAREHLSPKYLHLLGQTLNDKTVAKSIPLARLREHWQTAAEKDVAALVAEIDGWRPMLWKFVPIGSYRYGATTRAVAKEPPLSAVAEADAAGDAVLAEIAEFRRVFPPFICFPHVIPLDEVVCLKTFHREDEPLSRLFLSEQQTREIDRLWAEHRFIAKFPVVENEYLPLFIGFVTQDQPKELLAYFEGQRGAFRERAEAFERDFAAAAPRQLAQLDGFASQAYRRPITEVERRDLRKLYEAIRAKGVSHEDAFRELLARVLISPSFLLHLEQPPPGKQPQAINDWELASRLSYFLWSSLPDDELRQLAAAGRLREPEVLAAQTKRMLRDDRMRRLAIEFGTQWLHVRGFDAFNEKNERLFPTFDAELRAAMNEETIRLFQDLFQNDRPVTDLLDADYTFLNETLAKHYEIPNVIGPEWRRVMGVKQFGRGGILALGSVQAKQSGASRTSPVLRGNWVVETLLGERLPRPPPNIPPLPDGETGNDGLSMRQLVEKHTRAAECAVCHVRIDPFGFAFEKYDAIGRLRKADLGGLPIDSHARLRDGAEFDGLDGLRGYLLTQKRDVVIRLFCRRLLGYALRRSVTLSDQPLLDDMVAKMPQDGGRTSALVLAIVGSPQFGNIRGSETSDGK